MWCGQDLYTVVPSFTETAIAYANATSACRTADVVGSWVTDVSNTLEVDVEGVTGTISENSWPGVCTLSYLLVLTNIKS